MAENQGIQTQKPSNRERYLERMKARFPDREFADDEELYGQINDDYDEYDKQINGYKEQEKTLSDLMTSDPRAGYFLNDWRNGEDPLLSYVKRFGPELKEALESPEKAEALAEANKEYAERVAKSEEYEAEYQKNLEESNAVIDELQAEEGLSDEEIDERLQFIMKMTQDAILGKFTKESLQMAAKAINHDADVELADAEGEIRGRNAKIEEKLRRKKRGDGTANIAGKNGGAGAPQQKGSSIFDLARMAK